MACGRLIDHGWSSRHPPGIHVRSKVLPPCQICDALPTGRARGIDEPFTVGGGTPHPRGPAALPAHQARHPAAQPRRSTAHCRDRSSWSSAPVAQTPSRAGSHLPPQHSPALMALIEQPAHFLFRTSGPWVMPTCPTQSPDERRSIIKPMAEQLPQRHIVTEHAPCRPPVKRPTHIHCRGEAIRAA